MNKFTISYGALRKDANFEIHKDGKFLILRKQLTNVSMEEVITSASNILMDREENDTIIFFNGTQSDFNKLQSSVLVKEALSMYHAEKYENIENRLKFIELLHLEIQNGPCPLPETEEREFIECIANFEILGAGYCLSNHLWRQRNRVKEELLYNNNFSEQFTDMLGHYLSWIDDLYTRLYKLLD